MQEAQQTNPRQVEDSKRTKRLRTIRQQTRYPQQPQRIVIDVLHSTHPGAWGMTELEQRKW